MIHFRIANEPEFNRWMAKLKHFKPNFKKATKRFENKLGDYVVKELRRRIHEQDGAFASVPYVSDWPERKTQNHNMRLLHLGGYLKSIQWVLVGNRLIIGTDDPGALIHELGGKGYNRELPKPLWQETHEDLKEEVLKRLKAEIGEIL